LVVNIRALGIVWRASPWLALLSLITTLFTALMVPTQVWISREAIDIVSTALSRKAVLTSFWSNLVIPISLYLIVWSLGEFFQAISFSVNELIQRKVHYFAHQVVLKKSGFTQPGFL
jgi:hypothetical protein